MDTRLDHVARGPMIATAIVALVVAGGIYSARGTHSSPGSPPPSPAIPVTVHSLAEEKVLVWSEFSGRLHAVDSAEVRPEVGGRITEVLFEDGQSVKAGDILFVIDPRPYEAAVARAEANLASAGTDPGFAKVEFERAANIIASQAIPQRLYDERANTNRVANAAVKSADAALHPAAPDLEPADVERPKS